MFKLRPNAFCLFTIGDFDGLSDSSAKSVDINVIMTTPLPQLYAHILSLRYTDEQRFVLIIGDSTRPCKMGKVLRDLLQPMNALTVCLSVSYMVNSVYPQIDVATLALVGVGDPLRGSQKVKTALVFKGVKCRGLR